MARNSFMIDGAVLKPESGRLDGLAGSVHVEPLMVDLALALAERPGEVVSRDHLIESVWEGYPGADRGLTNAISKLRRALEAAGADSAVIETVPKRGYRLRADSIRQRSAAGPNQALPRIAVLPFRAHGMPPEDQYLGEAIAEDLHHALGSAQGIEIAARTSSFALACRDEPLAEFFRQLGATLALEGSVRRREDRIVVRLALSSTEDEAQLWCRDFEIPETRLDGLSAILLEALRQELREAQGVELRPAVEGHSSEVPGDAYKAFLKGRYFWYRENSNPGRALELYRHAIARAPEFAAPHAGLVDCYCAYGAWQMMPQVEARKLALNNAERALSIAPDSIDAQFSHGYAQLYARWRWADAERIFRHVLQRRPDHILAHSFLGLTLTILNRDDEAIEVGERLVQLDPASSWCWWMRGLWAFYRRDFECMAESGLEGLEVSAEDPLNLWIASGGLAQCGDRQRAREVVAKLEQVGGELDMFLGIAATVRIFCGDRETALAHRSELERRAAERPVSPLVMSFVHSALGDPEPALDALEAAHAEHNMVLWFLSRELTIDPLRDHPRFRRILAAMNLPEVESPAAGGTIRESARAVPRLADS